MSNSALPAREPRSKTSTEINLWKSSSLHSPRSHRRTMAAFKIQIKRIAEAQEMLQAVNDAAASDRFRQMLVDALNLVMDHAYSLLMSKVTSRTGALARSLIVRPSKSSTRLGAWFKAGSRGGGRLAPHAHLIEYGHRIVTRRGADTGKRARAFAFFRPAVDAKRSAVRSMVTRSLRAMFLDASYLRSITKRGAIRTL